MTTAGNALVVMTKVPEPGQSKTRLVPPLSYDEAAEVARALLLDQLDNLAYFAGAARFIAFTPARARAACEKFAGQNFICFVQQGDDFGARMCHAFDHLFKQGFRNVFLIGSDLPALPLAIFEAAYAWLDRFEACVVLAPSEDGGYYGVGMNRRLLDIFAGMTWSRNDVLAQTIDRLDRAGTKYKLLPACYDIDNPQDLKRLQVEIQNQYRSMKHTVRLLRRLEARGIVCPD